MGDDSLVRERERQRQRLKEKKKSRSKNCLWNGDDTKEDQFL